MKKTKVDSLGRIVIPISFRRELGLNNRCEVEVSLDGDRVVVRRLQNRFKLCYADVVGESEVCLCSNCIEKIKRM